MGVPWKRDVHGQSTDRVADRPGEEGSELLPRLLDSVAVARARCRRGTEAVEVIVADNASTDQTAAVARDRGCRVVSVEPRCIAAARNGGAAVVRGELLAFVDADSRIHPETFDAVDEAMASGAVVVGATGVELERWSAGIALTYALFMPRLCFGLLLGRRSAHELIEAYWYRARG